MPCIEGACVVIAACTYGENKGCWRYTVIIAVALMRWHCAGVLRSAECVRRLSELACVPVLRPSRDGNTWSNTQAAADDDNVMLVCYRGCILPADAHLAWTVLPVTPLQLIPPQPRVAALGILSPPPRDVVLMHIQHITGAVAYESVSAGTSADSSLDHWSHRDSPTTVFQSIYAYLSGMLTVVVLQTTVSYVFLGVLHLFCCFSARVLSYCLVPSLCMIVRCVISMSPCSQALPRHRLAWKRFYQTILTFLCVSCVHISALQLQR